MRCRRWPPGASVKIAAPAPSPKRNAVSWSLGLVMRESSSAVTTTTVRAVPLSDAIGRMKSVPLDCDTVLTARELGITFGEPGTEG